MYTNGEVHLLVAVWAVKGVKQPLSGRLTQPMRLFFRRIRPFLDFTARGIDTDSRRTGKRGEIGGGANLQLRNIITSAVTVNRFPEPRCRAVNNRPTYEDCGIIFAHQGNTPLKTRYIGSLYAMPK